jgi:hypothetical protein
VWTLHRDPQLIRCELRDDSQRDAGWEVQVFDGEWLSSRNMT